MFQIYLMMFWVPAIASGLLLVMTWRSGIIAHPRRLSIWFLVALFLQFASGLFTPVWAVGLVLQSSLAVYLVIQVQLG